MLQSNPIGTYVRTHFGGQLHNDVIDSQPKKGAMEKRHAAIQNITRHVLWVYKQIFLTAI
jgi:hypothetical protein